MPFVAVCPHCRSAKVQAPSRKRGMLHTCPKCSEQFPLEPLDETIPVVDYKLPPVEYDIAEAYREAPEDFAAARTQVQRPLRSDTRSEVVPLPEPLPVTPELLKTTVIQELDYTPDSTRPEPPLMIVMASGGLFGLAMILTQVPYGRIAAIPLLVIGIGLGLLAIPGLDMRRNWGRGAIVLNALGLVLVLLLPSWLGVNSWVPQGDPNAGPKPALSVPRDGSPSSPAGWVDARTALWQQDDVRVEVFSAKLEPVDGNAKKDAKLILKITIKVTNAGVGRPVPIIGWTPEAPPKLSLATGPMIAYRKVEAALPATLNAGKELPMVFVFEAPAAVESLNLELPAMGLSVQEPVRFSIPAAMVAKPVDPSKRHDR